MSEAGRPNLFTPYATHLFGVFAMLCPRALHRRVARGLVHLFLRFQPEVRRALAENLRVAGGARVSERAIRSMVRRIFINYGLYLCDYMTLPVRRRESVVDWFGRTQGEEHIVAARKRGRGVLLVGPHLGNWELAGFLLRDVDCPIHVISIRDLFPQFDRLRERFRTREGIRIIYVGGEDSSRGMLEIQAALGRNEAVAMLGDRLYFGRSYDAWFFGSPVQFPAGPLLVSALTGAPIIPFAAVREGDRYALEARPPIEILGASKEEIAEAGQRLADVFEGFVRRWPDQWYNFHPVFESDGLSRWRR